MEGQLILVIARMTVADGKEDEFLAAAATLIPATRSEPGCRSYTLLRDVEQPDCFVFAEDWADSAAFQMHVQSAHLAAFRDQSAGCVIGQAVTMHTVQKAGTL